MNNHILLIIIYLLIIIIITSTFKIYNTFINEANNTLNEGMLLENVLINSIISILYTLIYYINIETFIDIIKTFEYNVLILIMLIFFWLLLITINPKNLNISSVILLINLIGLLFLASTNNLIGFYLGLELYSLSSYVIATGCDEYRNSSPLKKSSVATSLKYFIVSAISSSIFLLGIGLNKSSLWITN